MWDVAGPRPKLLEARKEFSSPVLGMAFKAGSSSELACCSKEGISWLRDWLVVREAQQGVRFLARVRDLQSQPQHTSQAGRGAGAAAAGGIAPSIPSVAAVKGQEKEVLQGEFQLLGCSMLPAGGGAGQVLVLASSSSSGSGSSMGNNESPLLLRMDTSNLVRLSPPVGGPDTPPQRQGKVGNFLRKATDTIEAYKKQAQLFKWPPEPQPCQWRKHKPA
jgi:hypothetical protein